MRIEAIRLQNVRGFGEKGVVLEGFAPGLNVLAARNEFGKSTVFDATRALLFHRHATAHRDVRGLESDGEGAPEIWLDVARGENRFRIEKRFLRKKMARVTDLVSGRVVAEADDAERWVRELIGADKPGQGPTGLLWVEQGGSLAQPHDGDGRGDAVHDALGREVAEVTGGERARRVLGLARERLDALITRERRSPKAGGPYKLAADRVATLRGDERDLDERVRTGVDVRERLVRAQDEAARLARPEEESARVEALQKARALAVQAEGAADRLKVQQDTATRARDAVEIARDAATRRRGDEDGARAAFAAEEETATHMTAMEAAAEAAGRKSADTRAELKRAVDQEAAARRDRDAAVRAQDAVRAANDLEAVRITLADARKHAETLSSLGPARPLPDLTVAENASIALVRAEAQAEAVAVSLSVEQASDAHLDGLPLVPGTHLLTGTTRLTAPGLDIMIEAPEPAEARALEKARAAFARALSDLGAPSLAEARQAAEDGKTREAERARLNAMLKGLAPQGIGELERRDAELAALAAQGGEAPDLDAADRALEEASELVAKATGRAEAATTRQEETRATAATAREDAAVARTRAQEARDRLGAEKGWAAARADLERILNEAVAADTAAATALARASESAPDVEAARAEVQRLEQAEDNRRKRVLDVAREVERLGAELRHVRAEGAEEKLAETRGQLEAAEADEARYAREADALLLLTETLSAAQERRRVQHFGPLLAEIRPLLTTLFADGSIDLTDNLSPGRLERGGRQEPVERLSGGTREQLAVLVRLGFARLMAKAGNPVPVVLDDALVFADDARIARMFTALNLAGRDIQIIVLTCRQESFEDLGGTVLTPKTLDGAMLSVF